MNKNYIKSIFNTFRRTFISFILLISLLTIVSCKQVQTINNPIAIGYRDNEAYIINKEGQELSLEQYDEVLPVFSDYLMVKQNDKWGFISNTGKKITDIKYTRISQMKENKAVVVYKDKTQIINNKGEVIYNFSNGITSYGYFNENKLVIEKDGLLGYLKYNEKSNSFDILVDPIYKYADNFYEGKAAIGIDVNGVAKYSYLNEDGTLFFDQFIFNEADRFSCGYAKVQLNNSYEFVPSTPDWRNEYRYQMKIEQDSNYIYSSAHHFTPDSIGANCIKANGTFNIKIHGTFNSECNYKLYWFSTESYNIYNEVEFTMNEDYTCIELEAHKYGVYAIASDKYTGYVSPDQLKFDVQSYKYYYIEDELSLNNEIQYLKNKDTNEICSFEYAKRFEDNVAITADYIQNDINSEDETLIYYKDFYLLKTDGTKLYDEELYVYKPTTPKSFCPTNHLLIDNVHLIISENRASRKWVFIRLSHYQQPDENNEYYEIAQFENIKCNIDEKDKIIQRYIKDNNYTYTVAEANLQAISDLGTPIYNKTTNSYIIKSKVASEVGSKCGILEITTEPNLNPIKDNINERNIIIKYIVPIIYDNIIY